MPRALLFFAVLTLFAVVRPLPAPAFDEKPLTDPTEEARAEKLMTGLGCTLCQGQTIKVSDTPMAENLRRTVRDRVAAGDSNRQVRAYLKAHYSDQVIFENSRKRRSRLMWLAPWVLFKVGLVLLVLKFGRERFPILAKIEAFPVNAVRRLRARRKKRNNKK